jgi:glycerol-3-phosphate O-acyltransferase/dihydroxyacetone phosphate acyltransferase
MNRRLVTGYTHYKDDPRIVKLRENVTAYNKQLRLLGLRDHQVEYAKFSWFKVTWTLIYRIAKLIVMGTGALPGFLLFSPVFIATKIISIRKAREALQASTVKVQARDVMATWKLLVALAFAPICYNFYVVLFCILTYKHRFYGWIPEWVPTFMVAIAGWILFPSITFAALRFGEIAMDILKSLRPLVLSLNPTSVNTLVKLRERRAQLSIEVTELINSLGPEIFPDFDAHRIVADPFASNKGEPPVVSIRRPSGDGSLEAHAATVPDYQKHRIPEHENFGNLGSIGIFASRPSSRGRSRSGSEAFSVKALSGLGTDIGHASFDEVSKKIADAMKERRRRRRVSDSTGEDYEVVEESGSEGEEEVEEAEGGEEQYKKVN